MSQHFVMPLYKQAYKYKERRGLKSVIFVLCTAAPL